jgi:hypothetical protein
VSQPTSPQPLSERFRALIAPKRRTDKDGNPVERRVTENADFVAMLFRQIRALEARAIEDPEVLTQVLALAQRLAEIPNVTIAVCAERYQLDPYSAPSMAEIGRLLGITKQSASERRARGRETMDARLAAAGAVKFSEARRERSAIEAAEQHAVTSLAEYRARHAAA